VSEAWKKRKESRQVGIDQSRLVRCRLSGDDENAVGKSCELQETAYRETLGLAKQKFITCGGPSTVTPRRC
jgi:hypothetical protein